MAAAADIIYRAGTWSLTELPKGLDHVGAVNVIAHLLRLVAEDTILRTGDGAFHEIAQKAVEFRAGVPRSGEAPGAKAKPLISS